MVPGSYDEDALKQHVSIHDGHDEHGKGHEDKHDHGSSKKSEKKGKPNFKIAFCLLHIFGSTWDETW